MATGASDVGIEPRFCIGQKGVSPQAIDLKDGENISHLVRAVEISIESGGITATLHLVAGAVRLADLEPDADDDSAEASKPRRALS